MAPPSRGPEVSPMEVLIPADRIRQRVRGLAGEVAAVCRGEPVTIVGVLTGCVVFMADLIRHLDLPLRIAFLQASSYRGAATRPGRPGPRSSCGGGAHAPGWP